MKNISNGLGVLTLAVFGALAFLNWSAMAAPMSLDLLFFEVHAPVGLVLLGTAVVLLAVFMTFHASRQYGALRETKKLMQEMQRVQALADRAEASRIDSLQQQLTAEFRALRSSLAGQTMSNARATPP